MSWRNSKGQLQQVFLFLVAIIVIIATIVIGGKLFSLFGSTACGATDAEFVKDIQRALDENARFGSRNIVQIDAPCDATRLCFVDAVAIGNDIAADPTITLSVKNGIETNMFLEKESGILAVGYDERIALEATNTALCIPVQNGFTFTTEGFGRTVKIGVS